MANRWITQEETQWLYDNHFTVRSSWISPQEGYEFRLSYFGDGKVLAYRTTLRGCYNAARKIKAAEHRVQATIATSPKVV